MTKGAMVVTGAGKVNGDGKYWNITADWLATPLPREEATSVLYPDMPISHWEFSKNFNTENLG